MLQTERDLEAAQHRWESLVATREATKAALQSAERDLALVEDDRRTREIELKDIELRVRDASGSDGRGTSAQDLQKELFQVRAKESALRAESERLGREVLELNRRYIVLDARLKVRAEKGGAAGALAATDFLLSQRNLGKVAGIRGTVHELITFDAENTTALTVAAGNRFQALVVETDQVAEECIKLLRAEKRGRATFLPLNRILPGRPKGKSLVVAQSPGSLGFAIDLVHFDEEIRPASLVRFWGDHRDGGPRPGPQPDGRGPARHLAGRPHRSDGCDHRRLSRPLEGPGRGQCDRTQAARRGAPGEDRGRIGGEDPARGARGRVRTISEELAKRSGQADAKAQTRDVLAKDLSAARERLKECAQRLNEVEERKTSSEKSLAKVESESETLSKTLTELKASRDQHQQDYLGQLPAALSKRIQTLHDQNQAANDERMQVAGELEAARASMAAANKALEARRAEVSGLKASLTSKSKQVDSLRKTRDAAKEALEALRSVEAKQSVRVQGLTEERRKLDERRLKVAALLGTSQEALRTKVDVEHSETVRLETARSRLAEVEASLKELPKEAEDEPAVPLEELKRSIQTYQSQLDGMGSVNLLALEEYDAEKTRLDDFESEVGRLSQEKSDLTSLVGEIETKKREKLTTVTVQVNEGFREIYWRALGRRRGGDRPREPRRPARRWPPHQGPADREERPASRATERRREVAREPCVHLRAPALRPEPALRLRRGRHVARRRQRRERRADAPTQRRAGPVHRHLAAQGDPQVRPPALRRDDARRRLLARRRAEARRDRRRRRARTATRTPGPRAGRPRTGGRMTISRDPGPSALAVETPAVSREAAERVARLPRLPPGPCIGETRRKRPAMLERYLSLVQNLKEGVHVSSPTRSRRRPPSSSSSSWRRSSTRGRSTSSGSPRST